MITDSDCNKVYLSGKLEEHFPEEFTDIKIILNSHNYDVALLKGTKDIWARDYMPIQVDTEQFIQFRYEPVYLKNDLKLQSVPQNVLTENFIQARYSNINLDGGNVVKWTDKVIVTDRIFSENSNWKPTCLINELEHLFRAQVLIIPSIKGDLTGHADGHVRFINKDTLLVNSLDNELKYWRDGFLKTIKQHGLNYVEIPWTEHVDKKHKYHALGVYVNYLELEDVIVFPIFEIEGNKDDQAMKVMKQLFPNKAIEPININKIALEGGLLNCISWTIKV